MNPPQPRRIIPTRIDNPQPRRIIPTRIDDPPKKVDNDDVNFVPPVREVTKRAFTIKELKLAIKTAQQFIKKGSDYGNADEILVKAKKLEIDESILPKWVSFVSKYIDDHKEQKEHVPTSSSHEATLRQIIRLAENALGNKRDAVKYNKLSKEELSMADDVARQLKDDLLLPDIDALKLESRMIAKHNPHLLSSPTKRQLWVEEVLSHFENDDGRNIASKRQNIRRDSIYERYETDDNESEDDVVKTPRAKNPKPCTNGKIMNPATGRCVDANGRIGRKLSRVPS